MLYLLCLGFLDSNTINRHCQLNFGSLRTFCLLDLLTELELPDSLFDNINTLRLLYLSRTQKLTKTKS